MSTDREFDLVAALCRLAWSGAGIERCRSMAESVDANRVAAVAARHRVEAIVGDGLSQANLPIPAALLDARRNAARDHLRTIVDASRLLDALGAVGVDHLFFKGVTLASLAWPNPALKVSADIDLLIAPEALEQAAEALGQIGYRVAEPSSRASLTGWHVRRKESVWLGADGSQLDLHTALVDHPSLLDAPVMEAPRQLVTVAPGIALPTLADDLLYAYLCVHGAWSCWFRLKWIADLAAWLARRPGRVEHFHSIATGLGASRASAQALLLIDLLFGLDDSAELISRLSKDAVHIDLRDRALAELSGRRDLAEPLDRRFGTVGIHTAQLLLFPGFIPKARELTRQIGEIADRRLR